MNTYEDIRNKIKSGDLLAWTHKKWGSWYDIQIQIVRAFTQSEYCHVGIAWVIADRVFVLEAVGAGVRIFPLSREVPFYLIPLPEYWTPEVEKFAMEQVGLPYSKFQAVLAGLGLLKSGDDNAWECAEYASAIMQKGGLTWAAVDATPSKVVQSALDQGFTLSYIK